MNPRYIHGPDYIWPNHTYTVSSRYSVRVYKYKDLPRARSIDSSLNLFQRATSDICADEDDEILYQLDRAIKESKLKDILK